MPVALRPLTAEELSGFIVEDLERYVEERGRLNTPEAAA
jgi:hypothetical protein